MAEKLIELDSVELAAAVFEAVMRIFVCWKKDFPSLLFAGQQVKLTGEAEG